MQVVILAGGLGTRLSEETSLLPKPMVQIWWKPILRHIMKIYSSQGFNDFVICLGYKWHIIKDFFVNYYMHNSNITVDLENNTTQIHNTSSEKWKVTLIETWADTMTGGRIKKIIPYLNSEEFMLTYGDWVSNIDINALLKFHKSHGKLATLSSVVPEWKFGKLGLTWDQVIEFAEKKDNEDSRINAWFMVLNKKVYDYIESDDMPFEKNPLENIAKDWELMAFKHHGFWYAMDTLQMKNNLEKLWNSGNAPWKIR
jgi:glucose-1-phosphate cytidylyltransferase